MPRNDGTAPALSFRQTTHFCQGDIRIGLDRLMERKGVLGAGQFSPDGRVIRAFGEMSKEEMEKVALTCAIHEKNRWKRATDLREDTSLKWGKLNGWVLWAGNLALCVSGETGVFESSTGRKGNHHGTEKDRV